MAASKDVARTNTTHTAHRDRSSQQVGSCQPAPIVCRFNSGRSMISKQERCLSGVGGGRPLSPAERARDQSVEAETTGTDKRCNKCQPGDR